MKTLRILLLACAAACAFPAALTCAGCAAPSSRIQEVKTLKIVGASVEATMRLAAKLRHDGKLSDVQWEKVARFHDARYLPAFRLAVSAVQANLDSIASPDLLALASQLSALVSPTP